MSGPSDRAVEAMLARNSAIAGMDLAASVETFKSAQRLLEAAHDPALGLDRSVNERWCREDQTRKIVEWTRQQFWFPATPAGVAAATQREFGGSP